MLWSPTFSVDSDDAGRGRLAELGRDVVEPVFMLAVYLLAIVGAVLAPRRYVALVVLLVGYNTLAAMAFAGTVRYRAPFDFLLAILAAVALVRGWDRLRERRLRTGYQPMKVLHIQRIGGIGGSERHVLELLPALRTRGIDAHLSRARRHERGTRALLRGALRARRSVRATVRALAISTRGSRPKSVARYARDPAGPRSHASRSRRRVRRARRRGRPRMCSSPRSTTTIPSARGRAAIWRSC